MAARDFVLGDDDFGAGISTYRDPALGHDVLLSVDERDQTSSRADRRTRRAGTLLEDRPHLALHHVTRRAPLRVLRIEKLAAGNLDLVAVHQRSRLGAKRNAVYLDGGVATS